MGKRYRQVSLKDGWGAYLVCWVEDDPRLKKGLRLSLKEIPGTLWVVLDLYNVIHESPRKTWRVGGLG